MNSRLLELAQQAGLKKTHGSDTEYLGNFDWREFAELIVRECATVADTADTNACEWIGGNILTYFGVKNE